MKAIVLVGGKGSRLRPLTETIPKPLLPLVDRPLLDQLIDHLAAHGIDEVLLSSPEHEGAFRRYVATRDRRPCVRLLPEPAPLGTAGALANAVRALGLDEPFVAMNGDTPTDVDVTQLVHLHRSRGAAASLALTRVADAQPFGLVEYDSGGNVVAFREKPESPTSGVSLAWCLHGSGSRRSCMPADGQHGRGDQRIEEALNWQTQNRRHHLPTPSSRPREAPKWRSVRGHLASRPGGSWGFEWTA